MSTTNTTFQWTMVWEQEHSADDETPIRAQLQEWFDSRALAVCPRCRGMEARVETNPSRTQFHALVECTCLLSDPQKFAPQTIDGSLSETR